MEGRIGRDRASCEALPDCRRYRFGAAGGRSADRRATRTVVFRRVTGIGPDHDAPARWGFGSLTERPIAKDHHSEPGPGRVS